MREIRFHPEAVILASFEALLILAGIVLEPVAFVPGLRKILASPGLLITDYVAVGGLGAALVNAGLVGMVGVLLTVLWRVKPRGPEVAGILTMTGFALFGKNVLNIAPILGGSYLGALVTGRNFRESLTSAMFGTALAPVVSQAAYGLGWGWVPAVLVGLCTGLAAPLLAPVLYRCHMGLNLYNMGLSAGFLGTIVFALKSSFSHSFEPVFFWSVHGSSWLSRAFFLAFGAACVAALISAGGIPSRYGRILASTGRLPTDFTELAGWSATLFNMGIVGYVGWCYMHLCGGTFNGPTAGALLTMAGFAAYGKHPRTMLPVMAGVLVASSIMVWDVSSPGALLAALFGTALSPVAGVFGAAAGFLAGFVHTALVMHVGRAHGGMNLYNNGFSAGIVATLFLAVWPSAVIPLKRFRHIFRGAGGGTTAASGGATADAG
ncbi:MAG: DUF1576 domain-containing protein [Firmicutes bacterium]|nr:DUF1576 domain-containing protein [Bacillota bacterium]